MNPLVGPGRHHAARSIGRIAAATAIGIGIGSGVTGDYTSSREVVQRFIPADYAFAIWAPIYAGGAAFAARQVSGDATSTDARVRAPLAGAFLLSGFWARVDDPAANLALIGCTWACATAALWRLGPPDAQHPVVVEVPVGLMSGWITLAAAVAATEMLQRGGWSLGADPASVRWAFAALLATGTVAVGLTASRRTPWYPAAVVWGLVGVAVRTAAPPVATTAAVLSAATALTAGASVVVRRRTAAPAADQGI